MTHCPKCSDLARDLREAREELAEWRRQGLAQVDQSTEARAVEIRVRLARLGWPKRSVQPGEIRTLLALVKANGATCSRDHLLSALVTDHADHEVSIKSVDVRICRLRKVLKRAGLDGVIENRWGQGYVIPPTNLPRVKAWLAEVEA